MLYILQVWIFFILKHIHNIKRAWRISSSKQWARIRRLNRKTRWICSMHALMRIKWGRVWAGRNSLTATIWLHVFSAEEKWWRQFSWIPWKWLKMREQRPEKGQNLISPHKVEHTHRLKCTANWIRIAFVFAQRILIQYLFNVCSVFALWSRMNKL